MGTSSNKKKSPIIIFALGIAAVVLVTLVANWRSAFVRDVSFPLNNGVAYLFTRGSYLVAVSHDNKVYVWDWNNLSAKPRIVEVQSDQAVLLEAGRVVSVRESNARKIVVAELDDGKVHKEIPIAGEGNHVRLAVNRSGSAIVVMLARTNHETKVSDQEVVLVDCNAELVRPIAKLAEMAGEQMVSVAVSDDGGLVVLAGEKDGLGYVVLVDVEQRLVNWAKTLPDLQKVRSAVFSTDGKIIYIRGTDSTVQIMDTETGSVLKRLLPVSQNKSTAGVQHVQTLATSSDGRFITASISSTVYVWDCKTEKVIFRKEPGHKLVSGLAFSPDSKFLATSDTRQGGTIKIWRVPKH